MAVASVRDDATARRDREGSCPLCGATQGPIRMREADFVGRACECGTIYIDPVPARDALPPTVDAHLESYYSLPAELRMGWAARFAPTGRFLDVGCGSGSLLGCALARGFDVEAVEPNAACADHVRRRYGIPVEQARVEDADAGSAPFDLVFHVDLLSHFPDPIGALESIAARLRPDGVMCFEVGLFAGLAPRWYPWVGRPHFPAHRWFYDAGGIERLLERAGFELVAIETFAIAPATVLSSSLRRVLPQRMEAVPPPTGGADVLPARGSRAQRAYAWLHYALRYRLGARVALPGPQTAFVAARLAGGAT